MNWEVLAHGYGLAEAPTIDVDGSLVFSDVLGGGVYRLDSGGSVTTVVPKRRGVGGIAIHADGGIVCSGRDVVHVRDGETRTVLHVDGVAGWNDLCTDAAGRVYAGALRFAVFDPDAEVVPGELWRVGARRRAGTVCSATSCTRTASRVAPDGGTIYLSDTRRQRVIVFDVESSARREIDVVGARQSRRHGARRARRASGSRWCAAASRACTPDGDVDMRLEPPSAFTTSLCFAGRDLYVTTGGHSERPSCAAACSARRSTWPVPPCFAARVLNPSQPPTATS